MNPFYVCFFALFALAALSLLKSAKPEMYAPAAAVAGTVIFVYVAEGLAPVINELRGFAESAGGSGVFATMLKALGVALCCRAGADVCRDCGENSLAEKIAFAGKTAMLAMCLPVIKQLLSLAWELVS